MNIKSIFFIGVALFALLGAVLVSAHYAEQGDDKQGIEDEQYMGESNDQGKISEEPVGAAKCAGCAGCGSCGGTCGAPRCGCGA